jgi:hypothetical protein
LGVPGEAFTSNAVLDALELAERSPVFQRPLMNWTMPTRICG